MSTFECRWNHLHYWVMAPRMPCCYPRGGTVRVFLFTTQNAGTEITLPDFCTTNHEDFSNLLRQRNRLRTRREPIGGPDKLKYIAT
jgi:hypothetical protein